jgi:anhydro-N-acetylmuramic acid kinase
MVIDALVREITGGREQFDRDGRRALEGSVVESLLEKLQQHPFLQRKPPKSTGREEFGTPFALQLLRSFTESYAHEVNDLIATVTYWTAASIARAYRQHLPGAVDEVVLGGGGGKNKALVAFLRQELPGIRISRHADYGICDEAKEAIGFALLAKESLEGRPANVPAATGASQAVVLGSITPGALGGRRVIP